MFDFNIPAGGNWPDVMIDEETMGTKPGSPIIALGAVAFNLATMQVGPQFYVNISLKSAMALGAMPDGDTIIWWLTQNDEARRSITHGLKDDVPMALAKFSYWLAANTVGTDYHKIWACGTDMDVVLLAQHYRMIGKEPPWKFYNARDQRTVRELFPDAAHSIERKGHHNAVADALYQVELLIAIRRELASKGK